MLGVFEEGIYFPVGYVQCMLWVFEDGIYFPVGYV